MTTLTRQKIKALGEKYFIYIILLVFVLSRLNNLSLPYYWDEAWSYARAIIHMSQDGLTLLPGNTDVELTRGHPLLFYFLSALWMKIVGSGLIANHIFPLITSVFCILVFFFFCKNFFNITTAYLAVLLLIAQQIFLAQSTMLLPEIMLALLSVISVYAYFRKRWFVFVLSATCMVLTKESGLVLALVFLFDHFIITLFFRDARKRKNIFSVKIIYLLIPLIFFGLFILIQKAKTGWYFFPEHMDMIKSSFTDILKSLRKCSLLLIIENGRYLLFLAGLTALFFTFKQFRKDYTRVRIILLLSFFIIFYMLFCSLNFFSTRYLMSILPFTLAISAFLIIAVLKEKRVYLFFVSTALVLTTFAFTIFTGKNESDVSLSYRNSVLLHKEVVEYLEDHQWQDKKICGNLLMMFSLQEPLLGYLDNRSEPFSDICLLPDSTTEIVIVCSNDTLPYYSSIKSDPKFVLTKKFQRKKAWVEIYQQK